MNEDKIQKFLKNLFDLKYDWGSDGRRYNSNTIREEGRMQVEQVIRAFLLDNRDLRVAELEAKVFTYEQIISKSNFAPMVSESKNKEANT